jgi:hypothetical protein
MNTTLRDANGQSMTIRRGTSPVFTFAIVDGETGLPKNLIGTEIVFAISSRRETRVRDLVLTLGSGITQ